MVMAGLEACPRNCSHVYTNHCNRLRPSGAFHPSKNDLAFLGIIILNFVSSGPDGKCLYICLFS